MEVCPILKYSDLFEGKGCLGGKYTIIIDPDVPPVVNPPRRVPFTLMDPLRQKLDKLL